MLVDFCLISPPGRANEPFLPFGLGYVGAYMEQHGVQVSILDVKGDPYEALTEDAKQRIEARILEQVQALRPPLVGITCLVTEVEEVLGLSRRIKDSVKDTVVVVGGIHPTMYPQDLIFPGSPVDYVVIGEGEVTALELAQAVLGGQEPRDVPGLAWDEAGQVRKSPARAALENLDELPFLSYKQLDTGFYFRPNIYVIRNMFLSTTQVFTARGCPYKCTFCVNKNIESILGAKKPFRQRSVQRVVDEVEHLAQEYSVDGFYVYDDTFCIDKQHAFAFCKELLERNIKLTWAAETRVNLVTRELLEAMREAGCIQLDFGVESGSPEILKRIKKGISVEQAIETFRLCHQVGIRPLANFMFNTPGETEEDVQATLSLAKELNACYYTFSVMVPFPGTDIYEAVKPKLKADEYHLLTDAKKTLRDPRFKFAVHDLNLEKLTWGSHLSFNSLRRRMAFLFDARYLRQMLRSRKKRQYLTTLFHLLRRAVRYYLEYAEFIWKHLRLKRAGD